MVAFKVKYEWQDHLLAEVEIEDLAAAEPTIKLMVEFWSDWENRLGDNGGDYIRTWLKQLGLFILDNNRAPGKGDEGWCALDGTVAGITVTDIEPFGFWLEDVEIETKEAAHGA